jgi:hypothetical protein
MLACPAWRSGLMAGSGRVASWAPGSAALTSPGPSRCIHFLPGEAGSHLYRPPVRSAACGRVRRVIRMACAAYGKASPAATVTALRGALLLAAVPAAGLPVADRDQAPGQVLELGVQAGLRHYAEALGSPSTAGRPGPDWYSADPRLTVILH